jgi:anti-anti-sigma regulatory factor
MAGADDPAEDGGWDDPADAAGGALRLGRAPDARELRDALLALPPDASPAIDASEVERISCAAFQVLLATLRAAAARGGKLRVLNPSFAFTLAFEAFGLGGDDEPFTVEYC